MFDIVVDCWSTAVQLSTNFLWSTLLLLISSVVNTFTFEIKSALCTTTIWTHICFTSCVNTFPLEVYSWHNWVFQATNWTYLSFSSCVNTFPFKIKSALGTTGFCKQQIEHTLFLCWIKLFSFVFCWMSISGIFWYNKVQRMQMWKCVKLDMWFLLLLHDCVPWFSWFSVVVLFWLFYPGLLLFAWKQVWWFKVIQMWCDFPVVLCLNGSPGLLKFSFGLLLLLYIF